MDQTWQEINASMRTLENDVKKNSKTNSARRSFQTSANQSQQVVTYESTADATVTPVDNVEREEII